MTEFSIFDLVDFVKNLVYDLGYFGVFLGAFLESIFPPIPSEIIMSLSGFLIAQGKFQWFPTIFAAVLGNSLSVSLIWLAGRHFGRNMIIKYGKYVGVSETEINQGENLFNKHGYKIVFFLQMVPMARTLIAFPAGILKTKYWKFIIANSLGATIWMTILAYVGYTLGENWGTIEEAVKPFEDILLYGFIFVVLVLVFFWVRKKFLLSKV
jgi:membrane protein DedA with SNARE-associated domain